MERKTPQKVFADRYLNGKRGRVTQFIASNQDLYHNVIIPAIMDMEYHVMKLARVEDEFKVKRIGSVVIDKQIIFDQVQKLVRSTNSLKALQEHEDMEKREYEAMRERRIELFNTIVLERDLKYQKSKK